MSLRHQTNKRLAAGLGSTTNPGCTRGSGCAGSILLRSYCSLFPPPPCTAPHAQFPICWSMRGAWASTRVRMHSCYGMRMGCHMCGTFVHLRASVRCAPCAYAFVYMTFAPRAIVFCVFLCLVFVCLFLGVRLKRCWKWPSASEVAHDLHDCRSRSFRSPCPLHSRGQGRRSLPQRDSPPAPVVPFSLPPTFSGTGSQIAASKRQSACAGR